MCANNLLCAPQVAMKFLFDEALVNFTRSLWPVTVDQSVHLAGLLMQIRFGA